MVKQNPMINVGLKTSRYLCCQPFYHSLSFVVPLVAIRCHSLYHSLSLVVFRCHSLSFVVTRCTTRCHSLSFVVTCCTTRCHSLSLIVPLVVTRCTTRLSFYKRSFKIRVHETQKNKTCCY